MPTLLQINSTANWGSTGKIAEQIGARAMQRGWESYIAYGRSCNASKSKLIKIGSKIGVYWHVLESRLFDNHGLASRYATRKLIKQIESIKPDIIHLHNIHGYYLNYKLLFEYLNKIDTPVVWTLHDCWSFTGHCAHFIDFGCYKWKVQCSNCPKHQVYPTAYYDAAQRNYNIKRKLFCSKPNIHIVPVSAWLDNFVNDSFISNKDRVVMHNGIDTDIFKPSVKTENKLFNIIGVSSVWTNSKGLKDFFELRKKLDKDQYKITLVGLSKEQKEQLPEGIEGILRTNSAKELAELYSNADVFINPTYADTFPTTNLEAIACGTPVITYRTGGSPESVTEATGYVVEQGDLDGIIDAINEIRTNGKEHYSAACRKYAEEHFNKDICFDKYINLYEKLIKNR